MKKTALYDIHKENNAKIVDFAGWQMPVVYTGIREEHLAVRKSLGLFDVSHMGEILVKGTDALNFCQYLTTNDLSRIKINQAQYSIICNEKGGVVDDVLVYKFNDDEYLFCVNASNAFKDYNWMLENCSNFDVEVENVSSSYSQLALQGPKSVDVLKKVVGSEIELIKRFYFKEIQWDGSKIIVARTGYTGEEGFEIYLPWGKGPKLWSDIQEEGKKYDIFLCGLGSRDTLRLEMGYSLYGFEIDEDINPLEAGLDSYVRLEKQDFIGKDKLDAIVKTGLKRKLAAFEMIDKGIPRNGYKIYLKDTIVGYVTSGTLSPSLGRSIGLGLVKSGLTVNNELLVDIRNNKRSAKIVSLPFYKK
ncbi:MAG: glycine cleavage system aminomethyltransferase GcvT [Thermodesulfobacteriota bacterium]